MSDIILSNKEQPVIVNAERQNRGISEDLYYRFLDFLDVSENSIKAYQGWLKQFFLWLRENDIRFPQRRDILNYRDELRETKKPTTIQNYIVAIRQFFKWTELEGIYPDIAKNIKGAKVSKEHKKDAFTKKQAKKILDSIDRSTLVGKRDYAILSLMFTCGLRDIEVVRANVEDLRPVADFVAIFLLGKGRDERTDYVRIHQQTEDAIREYLMERESVSDTDPLFTSTSNRNMNGRMRVESISRIVKTRLRAAGFNSSRLTAHSIRHTSITLALLNGRGLREVQEFARHGNITTTMIYDHSLNRAKNGCGAAISDAIFEENE